MASVINDKKINKNLYLYTSQSLASDINMVNFLNDLKFPSLIPAQVGEMDRPLKVNEIENSIKLMPSGKASSPGGYVIECYKNLLINELLFF